MSTQRSFVIVGGGLAGAKAAQALREEGFDGRVVLIGAEAEPPYERPPLSKDFLRGESERDATHVHAADFYAQNRIELFRGVAAVSIDPGRGELALRSGERMRFDRLLLATGAQPRRLQIAGGELDGIHYLRTLSDSAELRDRLNEGGRLVVVGGGWIGAEVAASARQRGLDVVLIDPMSVPLERVLGAEVGAIYHDLHRGHGVQMLMGTGVTGFEGHGRVEQVRTRDGATIACDLVVVGVGVIPASELAAGAGLAVDDGIVVDAALQTSTAGIYAAGDVASHDHPQLGRIRVEHWATALHQGPAAARGMLGATAPYERLPYFFSDQYDMGMEYSGYARDWDQVVFRGDPRTHEFLVFWLRAGRVLAGMNVNVWDVAEDIQALIRGGRSIDARRLADPDVPLSDLDNERAAT